MNQGIQTENPPPSGSKKPDLVEISINDAKFQVERGNYEVQKLRTLGNVSPNEVLSELKDGKFRDLNNSAHVEIKGGEVFVSHLPSAGSS
jgi:hypothetical protein